MAALPYLSAPAAPQRPNEGILIGDRLYSQVYLTIDNSIVPEERLSPTPSMLDGLDLSFETDLRVLGCELIQAAGILLRMPQVRGGCGCCVWRVPGVLYAGPTPPGGALTGLGASKMAAGSHLPPIFFSLPQVAMATGQVLFQRFFYSKSFVKHSFEVSHA